MLLIYYLCKLFWLFINNIINDFYLNLYIINLLLKNNTLQQFNSVVIYINCKSSRYYIYIMVIKWVLLRSFINLILII